VEQLTALAKHICRILHATIVEMFRGKLRNGWVASVLQCNTPAAAERRAFHSLQHEKHNSKGRGKGSMPSGPTHSNRAG
jgi:hypothetical protein